MKVDPSLCQLLPLAFATCQALAHNPGTAWITPSGYQLTGQWAVIEMNESANHISNSVDTAADRNGNTKAPPPQTAAFASFAPAVRTRWVEDFLYIESNGLPTHGMMTGITSWQQQVPLPQPYTGTNAWRIPRHPKPASAPVGIRDRFLRGAIAIASNGIPIFNPQNNRGEISLDIGELDQWGGHCGRADDYHYHIAPLHLQKSLGPSLPIAYALDGYPIYGLTEPDGSPVTDLDACRGHASPELGYHYHASESYPFVQAAFHGTITEREDQVDPQPRAQPIRPALTPLRGARITSFQRHSNSRFSLAYQSGSIAHSIDYVILPDGSCRFTFEKDSPSETSTTYRPRSPGPERSGSRPGPRPPRQ
jgi:hypothetical protein